MNNIFDADKITEEANALIWQNLNETEDGFGIFSIVDNDSSTESQDSISSINIAKLGDKREIFSVEAFNPSRDKGKKDETNETVERFIADVVKYLDRSVWGEEDNLDNFRHRVLRFTYYEYHADRWGENFSLEDPHSIKQWDVIGGTLLEMPISDK